MFTVCMFCPTQIRGNRSAVLPVPGKAFLDTLPELYVFMKVNISYKVNAPACHREHLVVIFHLQLQIFVQVRLYSSQQSMKEFLALVQDHQVISIPEIIWSFPFFLYPVIERSEVIIC